MSHVYMYNYLKISKILQVTTLWRSQYGGSLGANLSKTLVGPDDSISGAPLKVASPAETF